MLAAPSAAIDLPLKILVREDNNGKVWISYNSPEYLRDRHDIPPELIPDIAGVAALVAKAGEQAGVEGQLIQVPPTLRAACTILPKGNGD